MQEQQKGRKPITDIVCPIVDTSGERSFKFKYLANPFIRRFLDRPRANWKGHTVSQGLEMTQDSTGSTEICGTLIKNSGLTQMVCTLSKVKRKEVNELVILI